MSMESNNETVLGIIADSVKNDYYTAVVKSEVTIDTLITPVIAELLSLCTNKSFVYITKEIPISIVSYKGKPSKLSRKTDFLLYEKDSENTPLNVYIVELKTSSSSIINDKQINSYLSKTNQTFFSESSDSIGKIFLNVLRAYYGNMSVEGNDFLSNLETVENELNGLKPEIYLKRKKFDGSKKYITQAKQMIDASYSEEEKKGKLIEWYNTPVKALYLVPGEKEVNQINDISNSIIEAVSFDTIIKKWSEDKERYKTKNNYFYLDWLICDVLKPLFGN